MHSIRKHTSLLTLTTYPARLNLLMHSNISMHIIEVNQSNNEMHLYDLRRSLWTINNLMPIISSLLLICSCYQLIFGTLRIINLTPMLSLLVTSVTIISKLVSNWYKNYINTFNFNLSIIWVVSIQNEFVKIILTIHSEIRWVVTYSPP